jgi:hypothetical protein
MSSIGINTKPRVDIHRPSCATRVMENFSCFCLSIFVQTQNTATGIPRYSSISSKRWCLLGNKKKEISKGKLTARHEISINTDFQIRSCGQDSNQRMQWRHTNLLTSTVYIVALPTNQTSVIHFTDSIVYPVLQLSLESKPGMSNVFFYLYMLKTD